MPACTFWKRNNCPATPPLGTGIEDFFSDLPHEPPERILIRSRLRLRGDFADLCLTAKGHRPAEGNLFPKKPDRWPALPELRALDLLDRWAELSPSSARTARLTERATLAPRSTTLL
jgi:hypothetical protein